MARRARRVLPMHFHPLAQRLRLPFLAGFPQRGHIERRRRRRRAQHVREQPPAADHDRRAIRIRRDRQHARLPEEPASPAIAELHRPIVAAVHVRDAVVLREPIVREGVIGQQQIGDAAILSKLIGDEQLGFLRHRFAQVFVEFGIQLRIGDEAGNLAQLEPPCREPLDERIRARIAQHAAHLLLEHRGIFQLAARGRIQQLLVGNAAPQEERELRREVQLGRRRDDSP